METRNRWIESEDFIQNDNAPDLYEDMPLDALSGMDRTALKQFIVDNMIPVRVKEKWKDEEIRQAIRELVPADALAALLVPPVKVEAPVVAPPSTSPSA